MWYCNITHNPLCSKTLQRMWNCEIDFRLFKVKKSIIGIHYLSTRRRWRVPRHNPSFRDVRHVTSYLDAANLIASFNAFFTRNFLSANCRKWDVNVCGRIVGTGNFPHCPKLLHSSPHSPWFPAHVGEGLGVGSVIKEIEETWSLRTFCTLRMLNSSANYRKWDVNIWGLYHWGRHFLRCLLSSLALPMATVMFGTALLVNFLKSRRI